MQQSSPNTSTVALCCCTFTALVIFIVGTFLWCSYFTISPVPADNTGMVLSQQELESYFHSHDRQLVKLCDQITKLSKHSKYIKLSSDHDMSDPPLPDPKQVIEAMDALHIQNLGTDYTGEVEFTLSATGSFNAGTASGYAFSTTPLADKNNPGYSVHYTLITEHWYSYSQKEW